MTVLFFQAKYVWEAVCLEREVFHLLPTQEMDTDLKTYNVMHRMY
jgi:hypothetical protein